MKDPCLSFYCSITVIVNPSSALIGIEVFQVNSEREDLTDAKLPLFLNTFFQFFSRYFFAHGRSGVTDKLLILEQRDL